MDKWLRAALDYLPRWIEHQMRMIQQPGCAIAVVHRGKPVLDLALGVANEANGEPLTPAHRFRVASHSKSFTAAGVLRLRDLGRCRLDDPVGRYVGGLHAGVAKTTLGQLLSHGAGLVRDGADAGQWALRRDFLDEATLRADLAGGPVIAPNSRFKYSNHGYGLAGLAIEAITGEAYRDWIAREIVAVSGLAHTEPDAPLGPTVAVAAAHSSRLPLGHRVVLPAQMSTNALAAATGFVSTARDLARFYFSLMPQARHSVLSEDARREMTRRQWRDPQTATDRGYGLGLATGVYAGLSWFGHGGSFPGMLSRTAALPALQLAVSVLTNAADAPAEAWVDSTMHLLEGFARHGSPSARSSAWTGRWWGLRGPVDLLPARGRVIVASPWSPTPLLDAAEIVPRGGRRGGARHGTIVQAVGLGHYGESARLESDASHRPHALWLGGTKLLPEEAFAQELLANAERKGRRRRQRTPRRPR